MFLLNILGYEISDNIFYISCAIFALLILILIIVIISKNKKRKKFKNRGLLYEQDPQD